MRTIQFKTIKQEVWSLELDDDTTIEQVKHKIAETRGQDGFPVEGQRLIYNGKLLEDSKTVAQLNIPDGKFIVVMVIKKPPPTANTDDNTQATSTTGATTTAGGAATLAGPATPPPTPRFMPTLTPKHRKIVDDIVAMGYPREQTIQACQAAFFNAERAVEYLCNGLPGATHTYRTRQVGAGNAEEGAQEGGAAIPADLAALANNPEFQQFQMLVQADPEALQQVMEHYQQAHPDIWALIRNAPEQFMNLLNAEPTGAPSPLPVLVISVTPEDSAAIDRLVAMGFPEQLAIEAYIACDKNEVMAINYILQRIEEMNNNQRRRNP